MRWAPDRSVPALSQHLMDLAGYYMDLGALGRMERRQAF